MIPTREERARRVTERAYAKINLFLRVEGKRADGFHELSTVMHTIGLHDDIAITEQKNADKAVSFYANVPFLPHDQRNLAVRAAMLFAERTGYRVPVRIDMKKTVPVAAGLAGGSSDAAAVLRGMNRLAGAPLSYATLCALGAEIGSDVPFCIRGGTMLCTGRGEIMAPLGGKEPCLHTVVAIGAREKVSTPAAFAALDAQYADFDGSVPHGGGDLAAMREALTAGDATAIAAQMHNDFEDVILPLCPHSRALRALMLENGALGAMMSGSGPSVFGVFARREDAMRVRDLIGNAAFCVSSAMPSRFALSI